MNATARDKPSVLFIGSGAPWIGGAGYLVRQQMLLKALARLDIDLHLAMFDLDETDVPPLFARSLTAIPVAIEVPESRFRSLLNDLVQRDPMSIRNLDCAAPRRTIAAMHPERFDAVVAYRCDFAHAAGVLDHRNLILDIDDPEHLRRAESARWNDDGNAAWQRNLDLRKLKRFEINSARRASACFVCQERDAEPFRAAGLEPIIVPNCVDVDASCPARYATAPTVLFVGNMKGSRHGPNIDGMLWLIKDVWPRIRRAMPEAECLLAGPLRDDVRAEVSTVEGVRILGFVEDLRALLQRASLSVAPIRFGTGTRIKILEAMAGGCPVVSTTKGKEGLEIEVNRDLLVADDAADFASACLTLLRDVPQAERIGRAGWKAVSDRYDRIKREQWLADVLAGLIGLPQQTQRQVA